MRIRNVMQKERDIRDNMKSRLPCKVNLNADTTAIRKTSNNNNGLREQLLEALLEFRNGAVPVDGQCHVLTEGKHERAVVRSTIQLLDLVN